MKADRSSLYSGVRYVCRFHPGLFGSLNKAEWDRPNSRTRTKCSYVVKVLQRDKRRALQRHQAVDMKVILKRVLKEMCCKNVN